MFLKKKSEEGFVLDELGELVMNFFYISRLEEEISRFLFELYFINYYPYIF